MILPIVIFMLVLSPVLVPTAITLVHQFAEWREKLAARPVRSFGQLRPGGLVPAAA